MTLPRGAETVCVCECKDASNGRSECKPHARAEPAMSNVIDGARPACGNSATATATRERARRWVLRSWHTVLAHAAKTDGISSLVSRAPLAGLTGAVAGGASNASGDAQKKLNVVANNILLAAVRDCGRSGVIVTEEEDAPVLGVASGGGYVACFDPIDGSSNIDAAVPTGATFGIYAPGECAVDDSDAPDEVLRKCLVNARRPGTDLVAAGYCMFSSSTVLVLTLRRRRGGVHAGLVAR